MMATVTLTLDSAADNAPAIQAAFESMKVGGVARGTLVLTGDGPARIASSLDLDGGLTLINQDQTALATGGARFSLVCEVALKPDAGMGRAVTVHGMAFPDVVARFFGGGQVGDYGLTIYDCMAAHVSVFGDTYAGTLLNLGNVSGVAANLKRTIMSRVRVVHARGCGAALEIANAQGFGVIESVWDDRSAAPSQIGASGDVTIQHYENYATAGLSAGLICQNIDSLHIGKLLLGDSAAYQVTFTNCNYVSIADCYIIGNKSGANAWPQASKGLRFVSSARIDVGILKGKLTNTLVEVDTSDLSIAQLEASQNYQVLHVMGTAQSNISLNGTTYRTIDRDVLVESTVPSGMLMLNGRSREANQGATAIPIVDCQAAGVVVSAQDFMITGMNAATTNGIKHVNAANLRIGSAAMLGKESIGGSLATNSFRKPDGTVAAIDSTTVFQSDRDLWLTVPITLNPTALSPASGHMRLGATVGGQNQATPNVSAPAGAAQGSVVVLTAFIPAWWYWKVQTANALVGAAYGFVR